VLSATWSYRSDVWGSAEYAFYNYDTGPVMNIDDHDQLDLSATYIRDLGEGQLKLMVYGTDVLETDGRVSRTFDAGAFAWHELVPGRQIGVTVGYEF
jgi:iron complex outermembrane receptor protein